MARYKDTDGNVVVDQEDIGRVITKESDEYQNWLSQGNTPDPADVVVETWLDKRLKSVADGGYGSIAEQLEMIGEQGMAAYQTHIALVKTNTPKV